MRNKGLIAGMMVLLLLAFAVGCKDRKKKTKLIQDTTPPVTMAEPPGGTYQDPVSVTLTSDEPATIYYTTDGSEPTVTHYVDTGPSPLAGIDISENATLKYFGIDESDAKNEEAVKSQKYIIGFAEDTTPPMTMADPPGGWYNSTVFVWLFVDEPATIYYTTDGSTPDNGSDTYANSIEIEENTVLKLFAIDNAGNEESVKTERYYFGDGPDKPWPMFGFDLHNTNRSPFIGPQAPVKKWEFNMSGQVYRPPAIDEDGTIYCGSGYALHALNPDGTLKWVIDLDGAIITTPAIGPDGTIYVGANNNPFNSYAFYALNPDGKIKWRCAVGDDVKGSPAIGADGTIYFGSDDNNVYAVNANGGKKWTFNTGDWVSCSPAIGDDGTIYIGSNTGKLYALNPDGSLKWEFAAGGWIICAPSIGADGTVYFGSTNAYLYALNPADGSEKWNFYGGRFYCPSLALGADGTIYFCASTDNLLAVNPDGTKKWAFPTGRSVTGQGALVDGAGTIYTGSWNGNFYAINPDGTKKWEFKAGGGGKDYSVTCSQSIAADGTIYFGFSAKAGKLFAIGE
jgi:outer membrane protein assembly factor BamB